MALVLDRAQEWAWFSLSRPWACSSDETMEFFKKRGAGIIRADRDEAKRTGSLDTFEELWQLPSEYRGRLGLVERTLSWENT